MTELGSDDDAGTAQQFNARRWIIRLIAVAFVLWGISFALFAFVDGLDRAGQLGDAFGVVNALFAAMGTCLLVYTLWLQREELGYQRVELRQAREAHQSSQQALHNQVRQQLELFRITNSIELLRRFEELRSHDHLDGARAVMGIVIRHQSYRKEDIQSSDATQFQQRFGPGVEPNFIPWEGSWNKGAAEVLEFLARWALLAQVNRGFVDDAFLSRVLDESKTMMLCLCRAAYLAGEHKHTRWWWNSDAHRAAALSYFPEIGGPEPYPLLK